MAVMARDLTRDELLLVAAAELVLMGMGLLLVILFGRFNLPQSWPCKNHQTESFS